VNQDEARALDGQLRRISRHPDLLLAFNAWVEAAIAYSALRARWSSMATAERAEHNPRRTALHNVAIDELNRLSREAPKHGFTNDWRAVIGNDRRRIGDFACWCALLRGLESR